MNSKGYICMVQNNKETDYLRLAYGLALSIRNTQQDNNKLSIVTDIKNIPEKYKNTFDSIIEIKKDRAKNADWKLHNIVDLYDYTPYDETIMLDSDMLFLSNIDHWWDTLKYRDLWFTTHARNFKNEKIPEDVVYREEFVENELPSVYNAFFYFKKSNTARQLFDMMKLVCENWDYCVKTYLYKKKPKIFSTDVAFGLSLKLLGSKNEATFHQISFPYFTHMKIQNQRWPLPNNKLDEKWSKCVDVSFENFNNTLGIKIGTIRQFGVFHYHEKDFLTDNMLNILEGDHHE